MSPAWSEKPQTAENEAKFLRALNKAYLKTEIDRLDQRSLEYLRALNQALGALITGPGRERSRRTR